MRYIAKHHNSGVSISIVDVEPGDEGTYELTRDDRIAEKEGKLKVFNTMEEAEAYAAPFNASAFKAKQQAVERAAMQNFKAKMAAAAECLTEAGQQLEDTAIILRVDQWQALLLIVQNDGANVQPETKGKVVSFAWHGVNWSAVKG